MSDMSQSNKKRKRNENGSKDTLIVSDGSAGVGPVVVTFPAIEPAKTTPFKFYCNPSSIPENSAHKGFEIENGIIAGETSAIDLYTGSSDHKPGSQYILGIKDKKSSKILLRNAPLHVLSRDVKAVKSLESLARTSHEERMIARNDLGEAFGSKKAKQAIKAMERNKVDVSAMENVIGHIQGSIEASTVTLPSREEAVTLADENRLIPRHNAHASSPDMARTVFFSSSLLFISLSLSLSGDTKLFTESQVYALHDIVPQVELDSIDVSRMLATPEEAKVSCLPYQRSQWINDHLASEFKSPKPHKLNLKILYFISCMFLFRAISMYKDREQLQKRMSSVSSEIIDGLLERFTEKSRNGKGPEMTNESKTRLLTYMFALCLRLDKYATDLTVLASDLSLNPASTTKYFKQLGCTVEALSTAERARRGLGPASANEPKRCVLKIPLEFPKQRYHRQQ